MSPAPVLESPDLFVVLRNIGGDIEISVTVQVSQGDVDGAGGIEQLVVPEPSLPDVFEPQHSSAGVAELGDRQVQVAISVEITGLNVGDAAGAVEQDVTVVMVAVSLQQEDAAHLAVVGKSVSQDGDKDVEVIVTVDVDDRRMGGRRHGNRNRMFGPRVVASTTVGDQTVGEGVAGEEFGF